MIIAALVMADEFYLSQILNEEDKELYETAEDIALGSGYEFDEKHCEIFVDVDRKSVAQAAMKLAQLQVAISYLG